MWRVASLSNLIDRGDRIELHDYDAAGTLQGDGASSDGTSVTIDGVSDLRDLQAASPSLEIRQNDR